MLPTIKTPIITPPAYAAPMTLEEIVAAETARVPYVAPKPEHGEEFSRYIERLAQSFEDWVNG